MEVYIKARLLMVLDQEKVLLILVVAVYNKHTKVGSTKTKWAAKDN